MLQLTPKLAAVLQGLLGFCAADTTWIPAQSITDIPFEQHPLGNSVRMKETMKIYTSYDIESGSNN